MIKLMTDTTWDSISLANCLLYFDNFLNHHDHEIQFFYETCGDYLPCITSIYPTVVNQSLLEMVNRFRSVF